MTQSPEYPDLLWMPPASWTKAGRASVQVVVIHDTEGSEGPASAEDGASYDQRRTDGTSTHYFHDSDSTVQCVRTEDLAHAARTQGNLRGIQHELCGREGQGVAGWADAVSLGTLHRAAKQVARDCRKWNIPVRRLTPAQVAAGVKGICGHVDITAAFPQDNGTHTDPGPSFPWSDFLAMVQGELEGDMALADDKIAITADTAAEIGKKAGDSVSAAVLLQLAVIHGARADDNAAAAKTQAADMVPIVESLDARLKTIESWYERIGDPNTSDADVAAALDALLGSRKAAVLALM